MKLKINLSELNVLIRALTKYADSAKMKSKSDECQRNDFMKECYINEWKEAESLIERLKDKGLNS